MTSPKERYQRDLQQPDFHPDPTQAHAVALTQALFEKLCQPIATPKPSLLSQFFKKPKTSALKGLYLWGGVGRGKTYIIDSFYDCLPHGQKMRVHFHRFMQDIHKELKKLPNTADPLNIVAANLAAHVRVLCLDEFHVHDITDAMLLSNLLHGLFENGTTLVTTSNIHPKDLYKNGLQRERFLPAIDLIQRHTEVVELNGATDYRLELLEKSGTYHTPIDHESEHKMLQHFSELNNEPTRIQEPVVINERAIETLGLCTDIIWFDFRQICETARSSADYLEIAQTYHTVLVSNVFQLNAAKDDVAKRFIHLIDALYDHNVKLVISAACEPPELYQGKKLQHEFQRTASRLQEMRSHDYLGSAHRSDI